MEQINTKNESSLIIDVLNKTHEIPNTNVSLVPETMASETFKTFISAIITYLPYAIYGLAVLILFSMIITYYDIITRDTFEILVFILLILLVGVTFNYFSCLIIMIMKNSVILRWVVFVILLLVNSAAFIYCSKNWHHHYVPISTNNLLFKILRKK